MSFIGKHSRVHEKKLSICNSQLQKFVRNMLVSYFFEHNERWLVTLVETTIGPLVHNLIYDNLLLTGSYFWYYEVC